MRYAGNTVSEMNKITHPCLTIVGGLAKTPLGQVKFMH